MTNGTIAFSAIAEGTTLSDIPDKAISNITVSGTGKVTGTLNRSAVTTIGSVVYDGTKFGLTATAGENGAIMTEVSNPIWKNDLITAITLKNDCTFVCDDATKSVLKSVTKTTSVKVMDGTNLSGSIANIVIDGVTWKANVASDGVTLKYSDGKGLTIIVR